MCTWPPDQCCIQDFFRKGGCKRPHNFVLPQNGMITNYKKLYYFPQPPYPHLVNYWYSLLLATCGQNSTKRLLPKCTKIIVRTIAQDPATMFELLEILGEFNPSVIIMILPPPSSSLLLHLVGLVGTLQVHFVPKIKLQERPLDTHKMQGNLLSALPRTSMLSLQCSSRTQAGAEGLAAPRQEIHPLLLALWTSLWPPVHFSQIPAEKYDNLYYLGSSCILPVLDTNLITNH